MATLKEQYEELAKKKRRLAIWEAIHFLADEKFISKDGRKVSGIREESTGGVIPEEEIEDVLQAIGEGPIAELQAEVEAIESQEVVVVSDDKKASA